MAEVLFVGKLFLGLVHAAAHDGLVKVYQMAVKVRAVHAGELGLAVYGKAAAAAHAGAVYHYGIHGDGGLDAVFLCEVAYGAHHGHGPKDEYFVIARAGLELLRKGLGNEALVAVGAVVGHYVEVLAGALEFLGEDIQAGAAEAYECVHVSAYGVKGLSLRVSYGNAQTARYHGGLFALQVVKLAGLAERACKVHEAIALLQEVKALRGGAYLLEYYGCRTLFAVVIRDGEGYALALFVNAKHNELPGQGLPCDVGRFDFYQRHRVVQTFFSYYTVHRLNIAPFRFLDIEVDNIISPI